MSHADEAMQRAHEAAQEREFEARLEQEFAGEPPVEQILRRVADDTTRRSRTPLWLAAAVILLGLGVTFALAWQARQAEDDETTQDPAPPIERTWPENVPRVYREDQLSQMPDELALVSFAMPVHKAGDLSRFTALQQLDVRFTPRTIVETIRSGGPAAGNRLEALADVPSLRRLSLHWLPLTPGDLTVLDQLKDLQLLELSAPFQINDELFTAMTNGSKSPTSPLDHAHGTAIARYSHACSLHIRDMEIRADGVRALADARLHTLILDASGGIASEALEALAELPTLRHLELRSCHGASITEDAGGAITRVGSPACSKAALQRIASLPLLESLTLSACYLDRDAVDALPRQLQRLDLSTSFGVDGHLEAVIAQMPELQVLGLPLTMADARDHLGRRRPPLSGTDVHTRRLDGATAAAILGARQWRALRLDGQLTEAVGTALSTQVLAHSLTLTPTRGSVPFTFVAGMPRLERVRFVEADLAEGTLAPLGDCASLREIVLEDCTRNRTVGIRFDDLPNGVSVRRVSHSTR